MNCPVCNIAMRVFDRETVEIMYCPQCGGVWLDRGKLERIIARTADAGDGERRRDREDDPDDDDRDNDNRRGGYLTDRGSRSDQSGDSERRPGGLRGFLGNLFEMD